MHDSDPTKRIPKSIGTDTKLFGSYTLTDVAVGLLPGVVVVLVLQVVVPPSLAVAGYPLQTLTLPVALAAIALGALFVYLTPTYTTSVAWLATVIGFHRGSKSLPHAEAAASTQVERVHPDRGVIERTDGALVGAVQVTPPTMALATDAEWAATAAAFRDFVNTAVEFPIQIYSTTERFPTDEYLAGYESRLADPDVKQNPQLAALIEEYVDWYAADIDRRRMTIRDHYVLVPVTPAEVTFERESLLRKLAALPVLGPFVRAWFAPGLAEERAAMFETVDDRLGRVEAGLRGIEGCSARRVDAADLTRLVAEFWAGQPREYDDMDRVLRTRPLVGGPR